MLLIELLNTAARGWDRATEGLGVPLESHWVEEGGCGREQADRPAGAAKARCLRSVRLMAVNMNLGRVSSRP